MCCDERQDYINQKGATTRKPPSNKKGPPLPASLIACLAFSGSSPGSVSVVALQDRSREPFPPNRRCSHHQVSEPRMQKKTGRSANESQEVQRCLPKVMRAWILLAREYSQQTTLWQRASKFLTPSVQIGVAYSLASEIDLQKVSGPQMHEPMRSAT